MTWYRPSTWQKKQKYLEGQISDKVLTDPATGKEFVPVLIPKHEAEKYRTTMERRAGKLSDRVAAKVRPLYRDKSSDAAATPTTDVGGQVSLFGYSQIAGAYYDRMKQEQGRIARYDEYKLLYRECVPACRALNVTVGNVFTSSDGDEESWTIQSDDKDVQKQLEDLDRRCEMHEFMPKFCRSTLKYGDGFLEPIVDLAFSVTRVKWVNPRYVYRNEDQHGRLDAEAAFEMRDESGEVYASFRYWQMIHARYDHDIENRYGDSFFLTMRKPTRQVSMMKDGVVIKWLTRSTKRYSIIVQAPRGTNREERERIKNDMKDELRRDRMTDNDGNLDLRKKVPLDEQDIFLVVDKGDDKTDVKLFDPGGVNDNYDGIRLFIDDQIMALGVPPAYMGIDKEVRGRAHLGWVDIEFARMLRVIQKMNAGVQRRVYDLQLMLTGQRSDDSKQYRVVYPAISFIDEKMKLEVQQLKWQIASEAKATLGVPTRWLLEHVVGLGEEDIEEIMIGLQEPVQQPQRSNPNDMQGYVQKMRMHGELMDLRDKLSYVVKHGLHKPAEF